MDPISSSAFNLHIGENAKAILEEQKQDEQFQEIIVSCRSLSHYESKRFKSLLPQIAATAISASFHIVVGISLAYSAILIPQLEDPESDLQVTQNESSWIASIIVVVVPFGSIIGGLIMDSIGRLNTIKLATLPVAIGWILIAVATNVPMLLVGRLLTGLAAAWGTSPAIVYITEIARADMRGSLISSAPAYASLGMVLAYLKGWFMSWRLVAWLSLIYTVVPAALIMFIPESPVWLVSRGRVEQARKSLEWINKYQPQPERKTETLAELQLNALQKDHYQKMQEQQKYTGSVRKQKLNALMQPTGYKPLLILMGLFFFQQFSGIYITLFYAVTFFEEVGSNINPYLASVLIGVVRFCMSCINTYMLKMFNRRPLVMTSAAGMAICMFLSGQYTLWIKNEETQERWVPVFALIMYVVTSMIGMLPIPWTMTAELFPIEIRGIAHSIAYSIANALMFASVQSYRTLQNAFGGAHGVQWFFAVISLAGMIYSFIFLPETHRKKLNDIQTYFKENTVYLGQNLNSNKAKKKSDGKRKENVQNGDKNTLRDAKVPGDVKNPINGHGDKLNVSIKVNESLNAIVNNRVTKADLESAKDDQEKNLISNAV